MSEDSYKLYAIRYGTNPRRRRVENLIYIGPEDLHDAPMPMDFFVWAAVGRNRVVLIDTGSDAATCRGRGHDFLRCPTEGLAQIGVRPSDVGDVITTHMHWDHAGNVALFADARLHVQRLEVAHAAGPSMARPFLRRPYDADQLSVYLRALYGGRVTFHDGAEEIAPGISLHKVGGHTPGMQVVRVRTERGNVVLASDAMHYFENLRLQNPFPVLVNAIDYIEALATVVALADGPEHIVPGHDPMVLATYPPVSPACAGVAVRLDMAPRTLEVEPKVVPAVKMRAAVMYEQGRQPPFALTRPLVVEDVELDEPGPGEVLVRIAAAGLCHSDLSAITGDRPRAVPAVVGHEAAGVVEAVGAGVQELSEGDHVVMVFVGSCGTCAYCMEGRPNLCQVSWTARATGTLQTGGRRLRIGENALHHWSGISAFAEYAVVVPSSVVRIDSDVPLEDAAIFGCAVVTGVGAVVNTAKATAGSTVAVVGLGGVGLSALLGASAVGAARIVAIDTSAAKLDLARALGATDAFDATDPDCSRQVLAALHGGVHYAIEAAGVAAAVELACAVTARGGTTVTAGLPGPTQTLAVPLAALVADERVIRGSYMGSCVPRRDIPRYIELYRRGKLPVQKLRSGTVTLDSINDGFDRLARGETVRDVLVLGDRTS